MLRIGIDIGGTFTDFVIYEAGTGKITTFKLLTDATNPARTMLQGLGKVLDHQPAQIIHGSTVATNALLERKGAHTALITTRGFKDVLEIGRQNRPSLYDWSVAPPPPLVPSDLRFDVDERVDSTGNVIIPLDLQQLSEILKNLAFNNIEAVAVCLLFSFLHPQHEQMIADELREAGYHVSVSSEILPEYREYERISTTVVNSYVSPLMARYLSTLQDALPRTNLQIMQSNGGMINIPEARSNGVRCILSGPAGGIVGAQHTASKVKQAGISGSSDPNDVIKIITFDMGGTSTDVSLIKGQPVLTTDAVVGGCPIHLPMLDIHTIGAGGGSIAYVDPGGSLRVGPQSAGASPGPACYGTGELPTVTDANLVLGRLIPDYFLGGTMQIYPERAYKALASLGRELNLSPIQAAFGVLDVVNIQMERALRVISVERGHDPAEFSLVSFGGAGGLHAADLARDLGIPRVIIPRYASTLSAFGMLTSNVVKDYVQTVMFPGDTAHEKIEIFFSPLVERGQTDIINQGIPKTQIEIQRSLDVRYRGQSYELNVPYSKNFAADFFAAHTALYGYGYTDKELEIVNIRVRATGRVETISLTPVDNQPVKATPKPQKYVSVELHGGKQSIPLYIYKQLGPGIRIDGPALIVSDDTTILVKEMDMVNVDRYQNLLIDIGHSINEQKY